MGLVLREPVEETIDDRLEFLNAEKLPAVVHAERGGLFLRLLVTHGRMPFGGERKILAAID